MRGVIFTLDAILALLVITTSLIAVNSFSNIQNQDLLYLHAQARDYADLKTKQVQLPLDQIPVTISEFEPANQEKFKETRLIQSAAKRYYKYCDCEARVCNLQDAQCLNAPGRVETKIIWSAK